MFRDFNEVICLGMGGSYSEIAKDKLFKRRNSTEFTTEIQNAIASDIDSCDPFDTPVQYTSKASVDSHVFKDDQPVYLVERSDYIADDTFNKFATYTVTVYVSYDNGKRVTSCSGMVIKTKLAP